MVFGIRGACELGILIVKIGSIRGLEVAAAIFCWFFVKYHSVQPLEKETKIKPM